MKKLYLLLIVYIFLVVFEPDLKYLAIKNFTQKFLHSICKMRTNKKKLNRYAKSLTGDSNYVQSS